MLVKEFLFHSVKWGMGTFWKCILVKFELNELVLTNDFLTAKGKVNSSSINASNTEDQNFLMSFTITFVCTDITVLFLTVIKALMIHYCIFPKTSYHHNLWFGVPHSMPATYPNRSNMFLYLSMRYCPPLMLNRKLQRAAGNCEDKELFSAFT